MANSGLIINTNVSALNTQRQLTKSSMALNQSMERLSSGLRINSAKDDAAGLAIANGMTSQIRGMSVAIRNANDGISTAQTAEAGMGVLTDTLQRMRDLAVQSANEGSVTTADREKLQNEFNQLNNEISRIITNTEFNGKKILNGDLSGGVIFQVGPNTAADNQISIDITNLSVTISNVTAASIGSNTTNANILSAIDAIDTAIKGIDQARSRLGAVQNRFTRTIANLQASVENQSAARSRIMDADFATETAALSRAKILRQAGTAMMAQANQKSQNVLSLLR